MDKDEAIKILKKQVINEPCHCEHCNKNREACNLLIDYIEELQYKLQDHINIETHRQIKQCYISKDKIREKIKYYKKLDKEYAKQGNFEMEIGLLKELLEGK